MSPYLIALLLGAALAGGGTWRVTSLHYQHVIDEKASEAAAAVAKANQQAQNAADDYEVWQSLQRPKTITQIREVQREIQADTDCSARALPDGLRDALTKAAADADQPIVDRALPATPPASAADVR